MNSIALVAIQSVQFPNAFLRIDGSAVKDPEGGGSGTVNCQFYKTGDIPIPNIGNDEVFELIPIINTNSQYAIRSLNYPQAFLRIDGSAVKDPEGEGSGTVNCQYYTPGTYPTGGEEYENLYIALASDGEIILNSYYIQSAIFKNAFLRIDGSAVKDPEGGGSGKVNCQYYTSGTYPTGGYELFNIIKLKPPVAGL